MGLREKKVVFITLSSRMHFCKLPLLCIYIGLVIGSFSDVLVGAKGVGSQIGGCYVRPGIPLLFAAWCQIYIKPTGSCASRPRCYTAAW
jgi:hypothetical protein